MRHVARGAVWTLVFEGRKLSIVPALLQKALVVAVLAACACGTGTDLRDEVGNTASVDGGTKPVDPPPTPITDPFNGAPAFTGKGGTTPHSENQGGISAATAAKQACSGGGSSCHSGEAPRLLVGGTVYKDYKGTVPAPGIEIRVVDGNGNAASTVSGTTGAFGIRATTVAFPAWVGIRDGKTSRPMVTPLTGSMGDCSQASCHVAGGYYPVHIP